MKLWGTVFRILVGRTKDGNGNDESETARHTVVTALNLEASNDSHHGSRRHVASDHELVSKQVAISKSITDTLVCPITLALPFDPVVAEDGRVYERAAIVKHMEGSSDLKSPMTNLAIGPTLIPFFQSKNLIETLIDSETIIGELADAWNAKRKEKQDFAELKIKAEEGDIQAVIGMACAYVLGQYGLPIDRDLAKAWVKKASDAGDVDCMAVFAVFSLGDGKDTTTAIALVSYAAAKGSKLACLELGEIYAKGEYGIEKNPAHAIRLLREGMDDSVCWYKPAQPSVKRRCKAVLEGLLATERLNSAGISEQMTAQTSFSCAPHVTRSA